MGWAPVLLHPAPIYSLLPSRQWQILPGPVPESAFSEGHFTAHYPENSPLDDLLRLATPGTDEYVAEGYAFDLLSLLREWSRQLQSGTAIAAAANFVDASIRATSLLPVRESKLHSGSVIEVIRREFDSRLLAGRERFLEDMKSYLGSLKRIETADFEIYQCTPGGESPVRLQADIRYEIAGRGDGQAREERIGNWRTEWSRHSEGWRVTNWVAGEETVSRATGPVFADITSKALGQNDSYKQQLTHGADYWRTVLDGAIGVDVYGNNGVAVGDFDNDGLDDLYVCQPAGLPNRLYRNRGDGTFEDVTQKSGLGVLDFTACAIFADFENRGIQDLLVVCASGPLLFLNNGSGSFSPKRDAFRFSQPPQGSFTHAAVADYDRDGRLDIYLCLYSYYQGLNQYRYPVPYFDARNGPANYLLHNEGNHIFEDRTEAAGLNVENDRYSFACSWGDANGDGWPDLYVVNDFGRNVLYRNKMDGTFATVSREARVDEAGAGMSACWLDFDGDGKQDIYAAGMWVTAGMRVFGDPHFHGGDAETIRSLYRQHMAGNSLYQNAGDGSFQNAGVKAGVEKGGWSWSTDSWDFDHDGYPDLYVANGYISGAGAQDVSSFFWRQVVAKSPQDASPSPEYERGWGAINELIRSDASWNGHERNVFFANNRDGTFCDISGVSGLDFRDDSRAFALADLDGDGRLEIILKNRNAPQLRILRLAMSGIGNAIAVRLRGEKSNRDAIGAAVMVEAGSLHQTKYLQAGSGFLSQHTKELFFGLGENRETVKVKIRWPTGSVQSFEQLPVNHRIRFREGADKCTSKPFAKSPKSWDQPDDSASAENIPFSVGTWLVEPVKAPEFSLADLSGNLRDLRTLRGRPVLLSFWSQHSRACLDLLKLLNASQAALAAGKIQIFAVNVDDASESHEIHSLVSRQKLSLSILLATQEIAGVYNIVYRYLFDRRRDLPLPASFLLNAEGEIVKVYQNMFAPGDLLQDVASLPGTGADRLRKALPFDGTLHQDTFQRNALTYGVAFFQHGFLDEAENSFRQAIASHPNDADAHYNLGTLYLRRNSPQEARQSLEQAVKLRPNYAEGWNNLGMLAAQSGNNQEAIRDFQQSLQLRPSYVTALLNLGNVYRREGNFEQSTRFLKRALDLEPANPEVNYSLGMVFARNNELEQAEHYLANAIKLRPGYSDALNNLGVLLVQRQRYPEAKENFEECIRKAPDFDQAYLNLARLYLVQNDKERARAILQELLQKQPQHKMAQQMLQLLY